MMNCLIVGLGGFLGSVLRYAVNLFTQTYFTNLTFPLATLTVNTVGCFVAGGFWAYAQKEGLIASPLFFFISVGILGGFTTFSAFGLESINLLKSQELLLLFLNILLNLVLGFGAVLLGQWLMAAK